MLPIVSKNLLYFCVFFNENYFKLLSLLLASMTMYSSKKTFDILILTSKQFEPAVHQLSKDYNIKLNIKTFDFKTIFEAACARLYIFDYEDIHSYEKILYLDTDIIIKDELAPLFDFNLKDVLYGLEQGTVESINFGVQFFDFTKINKYTTGLNSGTLLFKNSLVIRDLFSRIRGHIGAFTDSKQPIPYCMDQPFINYHAIKDNLYDNQLLIPFISLYEDNTAVSNYETSMICHFSFPIGNFNHKHYRMVTFLNNILNASCQSAELRHNVPLKLNILDSNSVSIPNTGSEYEPILVGKKYSWGHGYIYFKEGAILETGWGNGRYEYLGPNKIKAYWNNHYHVLKMNDDFSKFISIRTHPNDFTYVEGSIIETDFYIYGDSHPLLLFNNMELPHTNLFNYAITMHRIGRDQQIVNFYNSHNKQSRTFCFVYGEVDVRCHIANHMATRSLEEIVENLVTPYFLAIYTNIKEYKNIIVVAVPPPCDNRDYIPGRPGKPFLPFCGTNADRVRYTNYMNVKIKEACLKYNYIYFDPFDYYKRADGCLNYELSDDCIHIGDNRHFLNEMKELLYRLTR